MAERIVVKISDGSKLNSALKIWKQKSKYIVKELKQRKEFQKPSAQRREQLSKAIRKEKFIREGE
jgi:small subunit ribosomal protein S21